MDSFSQRKKDILSKLDKSSIGEWDKRIKPLCDKINSLEDYYTTSSCSGRIMIIKDQDKKEEDLFDFVCHEKIDYWGTIEDHVPKEGNHKFKQVPMILHIACRNIESAEKMLDKIREAGFKMAGIISLGKNIILEVIGTEKIEFPLVKNGKLLVNQEFLYEVLDKSNDNLEKNWKKIDKLAKIL